MPLICKSQPKLVDELTLLLVQVVLHFLIKQVNLVLTGKYAKFVLFLRTHQDHSLIDSCKSTICF